ncbi:cupin domain-containing protein [Pedobacter sp. SD-b]|uniref:Cupin domain-containing protein n=1 Tax=Pedobacter segetis TaxID=2793069 RepID=A0ABS1BHS3_9SPHI|nr:cupin domain-containing protein [Pedobacter segetis]MBK0382326.1 cupin domain-containing protein [Pedobacter segetis]
MTVKKICIIIIFSCITFHVFSQEKDTKIEVTKLAESTKSWNGDQLPAYPKGKPQITILKIVIPPHKKLDLHKHLVINAGVLLKGVLTVVDDKGDVLELKAGDSIVELVNTYHYGENKGDEPAEIIVFYAGVVGTPITVKK